MSAIPGCSAIGVRSSLSAAMKIWSSRIFESQLWSTRLVAQPDRLLFGETFNVELWKEVLACRDLGDRFGTIRSGSIERVARTDVASTGMPARVPFRLRGPQ